MESMAIIWDQKTKIPNLYCLFLQTVVIGQWVFQFVSTPVCCPSRSSILTGLYMHNHQTINNSFSGGCSGPHWQQNLESATFGSILHSAGYRTFYAGKYLNEVSCHKVVTSEIKASNSCAGSPGLESPLNQWAVFYLLVTFAHRPLGPCQWTSKVTSKKKQIYKLIS